MLVIQCYILHLCMEKKCGIKNAIFPEIKSAILYVFFFSTDAKNSKNAMYALKDICL